MVDYKQQDKVNNELRKGEIIFANHKLEFLRFFESHKRLCDEIAGLKYHTLTDTTKLLIDRSNFDFGIKKLNSFIIDYLHYIEEEPKRNHVEGEFKQLEEEFINDINYHNYIKKKEDLSSLQDMDFNKRYVYYLMKAFDISYLMSKYLQKSLNLASREVVKNIQFINYDGFFNNLSIYREEVANNLSNFKYETLFDHFKKIIGYFYTYRYLITNREQKHIDTLLKLIHKYIINGDTARTILKMKESGELSNSFKSDIRSDLIILRDAFNKVYYLCNYSLSMKNILPKTKTDILIDNTLI